MALSVPPESAARFAADCGALGLARDAPLGLAVSGGADSLALLLLAHAAGFPARAATVDHRLREAAAAEARFVARVCKRLRIPHETLAVVPYAKGNVSAWARAARYDALMAWRKRHGLAAILTAHHADDQLETLVMRLNRGSGVAGLSGIRAAGAGLARPLLGWRRAELARIVGDAGLAPVDDPSNRDDRYDRARLRKVLAGADWLDPQAAARSARALADAEDALDWAAAKLEPAVLKTGDATLTLTPGKLPNELLRRLFLTALARIGAAREPRAESADRAIAALKRGETVTLAGVKCAGGPAWTLSPAPARRTIKRPIDASG